MHMLAGMWPVSVAACVGGVVANLLNICNDWQTRHGIQQGVGCVSNNDALIIMCLA